MLPLTRHILKTADIAAGYLVGRLVIDENRPFLQMTDGSLLPITDTVEVYNGGAWQRLTRIDYYRPAFEGWPAYTGLDARMKGDKC